MGELVVLRVEMGPDTKGGAADVPEERVPGVVDAGAAGDGDLCAGGEPDGSDARAGVL